jgi:tetratricopeptide (TPR) repeat protein
VGLFVAAVWGLTAIVGERRRPLAFAGGAVLLACAGGTWLQLRHWQNSLTLWRHTFAVTEDNFICRDSLAAALLDRGEVEEAVLHLERAAELRPTHDLAFLLLGVAARVQKRPEAAARHFHAALKCNPYNADSHAALAELLAEQGNLAGAEKEARLALDINPASAPALAALATVQQKCGHPEQAQATLKEAVQHAPNSVALRERLREGERE